MSRFDLGDAPVWADIDEVESVYRQLLELRERTSKESNSPAGNALTYPEWDQVGASGSIGFT
jgi:hypothetical protein